jgi:hypothetical protein
MKRSASWRRRFPANAIADLTGRVLCVILELHPEEGRKPEMAYLPAMGIGEGDEPMFPMKKPIRLLAMRFQVD